MAAAGLQVNSKKPAGIDKISDRRIFVYSHNFRHGGSSAVIARVFLVLAVIGLMAVACSDNDNPTGPEPAQSVAEYIWFDTTSILIAQSTSDYYRPVEGYWVDGDSIIGEPFIDSNHNGVYDPGVDGFVMAADPAVNMDLNRNGRYDGPYDLYYPGEPYEDYNQNGVYDAPEQAYDIGEPFFDVNGNGIHDDSPRGGGLILQGGWRHDTSSSVYHWFYRDSVARWESPLGQVFVFPTHSQVWNQSAQDYRWDPLVNVYYSTDSLKFQDNATWMIPLAELGEATTGVDTVQMIRIATPGLTARMRRTTELGQSIEIESLTYEGLLRIRFDQFVLFDNTADNSIFYEFYFSKDLGLLAGSWKPYFGKANSFYRYGQFDTLPQPMIRDTITPQA